ncbi:MAG: YraN family protein [Bacteroidales bacterium]|jgi:putative endonuclease
MAEHNELGKKGEELAQKYLVKKGYTVLATNWRYSKDEIDIIARTDNCLVVVEVKTRFSNAFGDPEEFVSNKKQSFLIRAANAYVEKNSITDEVRFDIISVLCHGSDWKINHIEDAFYPSRYNQ